MHYQAQIPSPLGQITLASDGEHLTGLWIEGQKYHGGRADEMAATNSPPIFADTAAWLDRYFAGEKPAISGLPLAPGGSPFRQAVWEILCTIPYGSIMTYGEIAAEMAARMERESMSGQAVGGAVGHNPISVIIPCHRVVGTNGSLTGYAGGIEKKQFLLAHEGVDITRFFVPLQGTAL